MSNTLPDLWKECYDGVARQTMAPEEFKNQFCQNCVNAGCRNSKGAGTNWVRRMLSQEDILLHNPKFADQNDPQFRELSRMDFRDTLRKALAIEVADRRGDWSVPNDQDIGRAAAELVGLRPSSFKQAEPEPPTRLVDEVKLTDPPKAVLTVSEDGQSAFLGTDRVEVTLIKPGASRMRGQNDILVALDDAQDPLPPEKPEGQWKIRGDTGNIYQVTLSKDQTWACTCPSRENPCKHAQSIAKRLSRMAPAPPSTTPAQLPPAQPPPGGPVPFRPKGGQNTATPQKGVMIGGAPPPEPEDPWAPAPSRSKKDRVIPVGGKIKFSR